MLRLGSSAFARGAIRQQAMNANLDQEAAPGPAAFGVLRRFAGAVLHPAWLERGDIVAATARACLAISIAVHALLLLWLMLGPGSKPFDAANAEPIVVELLPAPDSAGEAKAESPKLDLPKSENGKTDDPAAGKEASKPAPKPSAAASAQKSQPQSSAKMTSQQLQEEQA